MATKQELEDDINDRLELDIEWSELKKDDVQKIADGLDEEDFIKRFLAAYADSRAGDIAQEQVMGWQPGQLIKLAGQVQEGEATPMDFFM